jgi:hypothetical protein
MTHERLDRRQVQTPGKEGAVEPSDRGADHGAGNDPRFEEAMGMPT